MSEHALTHVKAPAAEALGQRTKPSKCEMGRVQSFALLGALASLQLAWIAGLLYGALRLLGIA